MTYKFLSILNLCTETDATKHAEASIEIEGSHRFRRDALTVDAVYEASQNVHPIGIVLIHSGCDAAPPSVEGKHDEVHLQRSTRIAVTAAS